MVGFLWRQSTATWLWLAGLAMLALGVAVLATGAPGTSTVEDLLAAPRPVLTAGVVLGGLGSLLLIAGLGLFVFVPAFQPGMANQQYGSHATIIASLLLAVVLANLGTLLYLRLLGPETGLLRPLDLLIAVGALNAALLLILYLRIVRPKVMGWRSLGLKAEGMGEQVFLGLSAGLLLFLLAALLGFVLSQFGVEQTQVERFEMVRKASLFEFSLILAMGGLVTGFAEEAFFRGYVFQAYVKQKGLWQAYIYSSVLFAAVHLDLRAFLPILLIGFGLAVLYRRSGSLVTCSLAHAVNNCITFCVLYFAPMSGV